MVFSDRGVVILSTDSLGGAGKRHSLGAGRFKRATTASGVKVAQHPQGLTLTPAQDGGARCRRRKRDGKRAYDRREYVEG